MTDPQPLDPQQLIAKWRAMQTPEGWEDETAALCADELEAALASAAGGRSTMNRQAALDLLDKWISEDTTDATVEDDAALDDLLARIATRERLSLRSPTGPSPSWTPPTDLNEGNIEGKSPLERIAFLALIGDNTTSTMHKALRQIFQIADDALRAQPTPSDTKKD